MENLPGTRAKPNGGWQLSSEARKERDAHRHWIKGRVFALLSHYWRDDDPEHLLAAIGEDWADVLEGIPQQFIQRACIKYQREEPRRKPTPGAIYNRAISMMPARRIVSAKNPVAKIQRVTCDPETAQRILEEAGFAPKRVGRAADE